MSKQDYLKRVAAVLGCTYKNLAAAVEVVDKEIEDAEKAERGQEKIETGAKTSDSLDTPSHDADLHSHGNEVDSAPTSDEGSSDEE